MSKRYCSKGRLYTCDTITTFREVMDNIMWDWDSQHYLKKTDDGNYYLNKTTIGKDFIDYKMEYSPLADGLFDKVEKLYKLLNE